MKSQQLLARLTLVVLIAVAPLVARADQLWDWRYTSDPALSDAGLNAEAHGTLSTASAGALVNIVSLGGVYNGATILGLTPLNANTHFSYDNLISTSDPYLSIRGLMFTIAGTNEQHNLFFIGENGNGAPLYYDGYFSDEVHFTGGTFTLSAVTAVPELSPYLLLLAGLGSVGMAAQRRRC
jgi:hypothetical protein